MICNSSAPTSLLPLQTWPLAERAQVRGVLTDIDDTLTADGRVTPEALQALVGLRHAGVPVFAITGRPAGWSEALLRAEPALALGAVVAENGGVVLIPRRQADGTLEVGRRYWHDDATRAAHHARLQAAAQRVLQEVPGATLADDSPGRETDIAIDHSEFRHLSPPDIARVVGLLRQEGLQATVSSIHINGWLGNQNKLQAAHWVLRDMLGLDLSLPAEQARWVYVGDSTNDQLLFEALPCTVGVANIARFLPELQHTPRYMTQAERGAGFAEVVQAILSAA
jgi:HAD superfamily hydrolase (TIGR01484 family)